MELHCCQFGRVWNCSICTVAVSPDLLLLNMIMRARVTFENACHVSTYFGMDSSIPSRSLDKSSIFFSKWIFNFIRSSASGSSSTLFCFFEPSDARERELIFVDHSASNRSIKCWQFFIDLSSFCRRAQLLRTSAVPKLECQGWNSYL